ncbi:uncharacterized protein BDCG_16710 [Blastomyces dermatitidis ER-3]|uniref:Uncharacterized protein n=2 Tax=Ajellomyces dermatitidis TaxID=5039 RepID=A0A0J9EL03_AJEDA|nr:uncharacterized protein BDCG_16710 [Blastomyces dermatitidis ER-3]KMW67023.1 hypothetical protein BDDG_11868 [Blastomyces dermatitidis ATCC 18188]OAT00644.1 hypothetical protein BDCG_16710 [Blastomyces dermatitidis ER-3]
MEENQHNTYGSWIMDRDLWLLESFQLRFRNIILVIASQIDQIGAVDGAGHPLSPKLNSPGGMSMSGFGERLGNAGTRRGMERSNDRERKEKGERQEIKKRT